MSCCVRIEYVYRRRGACRGVTIILLMLLASVARAGVATDGTLGVRQTLAGPHFYIPPGLGRQVGGNLFHSFDTFDIAAGETATFNGPPSVHNILARVTGGQASTINGTIACPIDGGNLYLVNPSGVIFGVGAALDVRGSFAVATADVIRAQGGGTFAARAAPSASLLTTAAPAAFGFLKATRPVAVRVDSATLAVPPGKVLSVVAGGITVTSATLAAPAGRINLVAAGPRSTTTLDPASVDAPLSQSPGTARGDIDASHTSLVDASGAVGGRVSVNAGRLRMADETAFESQTGGDHAGLGIDVNVDALRIFSGSGFLSASVSGSGRAGDILARVGSILIDGAGVSDTTGFLAQSLDTSRGGAGNITLTAGRMTLRAGGEISSVTFGAGDAGNISVKADHLSIDGAAADKFTGIGSQCRVPTASGNSGAITVAAGDLTLRSGSEISASTFGQGHAGDVNVRAGRLLIDGMGVGRFTGIRSFAFQGSSGSAGSVSVTASEMTLRSGGAIASSTFGSGDAGALAIRSDHLLINGGGSDQPTGVLSQGEMGSTGAAGNITVTASDTLTLRAGGTISGGTFGPGDAGDVVVRSDHLVINGAGRVRFTGVGSQSNIGATGRSGDVSVTAGDLTMRARAVISSSTFGPGDAGDVNVNVRSVRINGGESDNFTGISSDTNSEGAGGAGGTVSVTAMSLTLEAAGQVSTESAGLGKGGAIAIQANELMIRTGAFINSFSDALGNGGDVTIRSDHFVIDGSGSDNLTGINSKTFSAKAGNILVVAGDLTLRSNGEINCNTLGGGSAGNVRIRSRQLLIDGVGSSYGTGIYSQSVSEGLGGPAGQVTVTADQMTLRLGFVSTETSGRGNAGEIFVSARALHLDGVSSITSSTGGSGKAGGVSVRADSISIREASDISSATFDLGDAGAVNVRAHRLAIDDSSIGSDANFPGPSGRAGNVVVRAKDLTLTNGGMITSSTYGEGDGGSVRVHADRLFATGVDSVGINSGVAARSVVVRAGISSGRAGDVHVTAGQLTLADGAQVTASADASGAGSVTIHAARGIDLIDRRTSIAPALRSVGSDAAPPNTQISAFSLGGSGGNITLVTPGHVTLFNSLITARAAGDGAVIKIDPPAVVLNRSVIDGRAKGQPVAVTIDPAAVFIMTRDSRILSDAISVPLDIDLSGAVVPVRVALSADNLTLQQACPARLEAGGDVSSFLILGRGGQPIAPGGVAPSLHPWRAGDPR